MSDGIWLPLFVGCFFLCRIAITMSRVFIRGHGM
jgi:hypothetical protein